LIIGLSGIVEVGYLLALGRNETGIGQEGEGGG